MSWFRTIGILRMANLRNVADILLNLTAKGHCQRLDASTDAQHGNLAIIGQLGNQQFRQVTFRIDATQTWRRLLASIERIKISTTRQ